MRFIDGLGFDLSAIGIAVPGGVNADGTSITVTDSLPMTCFTPASFFTKEGIPVVMVGDMHAAILAVCLDHPDADNLAVVMMGTGVACGYRRIDRKTGMPVFGGIDLGYLVYDTPEGARYLNDIAGGYEILEAGGCSGAELAKRAAEGQTKAVTVIQKAGYYVGMSLSAVRLATGAKTIVIGGGASTFPGMIETIRETFERTCLPLYRDGVSVHGPQDPTMLVGRGAIISADRRLNQADSAGQSGN